MFRPTPTDAQRRSVASIAERTGVNVAHVQRLVDAGTIRILFNGGIEFPNLGRWAIVGLLMNVAFFITLSAMLVHSMFVAPQTADIGLRVSLVAILGGAIQWFMWRVFYLQVRDAQQIQRAIDTPPGAPG